MAYYVIITRQRDRSIRDCGITPEEWFQIVHDEPSLRFVTDERTKFHLAEHVSNGDGLWLDWGGIHCEHPKEETISLMIGIARRINAHLYDTDGYIDPSWYDNRWWIDDERKALELFTDFRARFGRDPKDEAEILAFDEQQQQEMIEQLPDWAKVIPVSQPDPRTNDT